MTTIYSDGGSHTITADTGGGVVVNHKTTLTVAAGAVITAVRGSADLAGGYVHYPGVGGTAGSTINVTGGTVTGAGWSGFIGGTIPYALPGGAAISGRELTLPGPTATTFADGVSGAAINVSGGVLNGGGISYSGPGPAVKAGDYGGTLTISGGTLNGDPAVDFYGFDVTISGGTFNGLGNADNANPPMVAAKIYVLGGGTATISGGVYTPSIGTVAVDLRHLGATGTSTISGGVFNGSIYVEIRGGTVTFSGSGLAYSGGVLTGTLTDGSPISSAITLTAGSLSSASSSAVVFGA